MDAFVVKTDQLSCVDDENATCYFNEIPAFVELEIERLYNTLHSSLPFFRIFRTAKKVSTYVAWQDGKPTVILLFQIIGRTVHVLNEMIDLPKKEVERFASCLFEKQPQVHIISFKAIRTTLDSFAYPVQMHNAKDTYVITLPPTPEQYLASLGKSLRKDILKDLRRIRRDHPSFEVCCYEKEDIPEQVIRKLIRMSEDRIAQKAIAFAHDEQRILALTRQRGFISAIKIDGEVCAGTVGYYIGSGCFQELVARDPAYKNYGIGILVLYLTICECIRREKKNFYLGGGRFDYKQKLLGVLSHADQVEIYRSRAVRFLHLFHAMQALKDNYVRRAKVWVHTNHEHVLARTAVGAFKFFKHYRPLFLQIIKRASVVFLCGAEWHDGVLPP